MTTDEIRMFMRYILATSDEELDCTAVLDVAPHFADREVRGDGPPPSTHPAPKHFTWCRHCADAYQSLVEVTRLEAGGSLPTTDQLWQQLAIVLPRRHRTGAASARAAPAVAAAPAEAARPGRPAAWTQRVVHVLAVFQPARRAAFAGLAVAVIVLGFGWQRSARQARDQNALIEVMGHLDRVATAAGPNGEWMRVWWTPERRRAVIYTGNLPILKPGQALQCWLKDRSGKAELAQAVHQAGQAIDWWMIETRAPFSAYRNLAVTLYPDNTPMFEVALGDAPGAPTR